MVLITMALGLRHAFRRTATQPLFLVVYAALLATIVLGLLIDSDHWRHFYLLMGLTWGLLVAEERVERTRRAPRIVADRRPILLQSTIVVPPARRRPRIVRRAPPPIPRHHRPRRPARIAGRA
jgi:hypothetical protein